MKKILVIAFVLSAMYSCKKQSINSEQEKTPPVKTPIIENQQPDTCCAVPLVETSPGVFETTQNYFGAHLTFNTLQIRGGRPYAKLINARAFGSPAGGSYYNIIAEGLQENGIPQRNFVFEMTLCSAPVVKEKREITMEEYYGVVPGAFHSFAYGGNGYIATGNFDNIGLGDILFLYDRIYDSAAIVYSYLKIYGTFTSCSTRSLVSGKVIARYRPNTNNPRVYDYYVVPVKNNNEDNVFQVGPPE